MFYISWHIDVWPRDVYSVDRCRHSRGIQRCYGHKWNYGKANQSTRVKWNYRDWVCHQNICPRGKCIGISNVCIRSTEGAFQVTYWRLVLCCALVWFSIISSTKSCKRIIWQAPILLYDWPGSANYHTCPCAYQWFQGCACKVCETHRLKVKWQKRTG